MKCDKCNNEVSKTFKENEKWLCKNCSKGKHTALRVVINWRGNFGTYRYKSYVEILECDIPFNGCRNIPFIINGVESQYLSLLV
jgi:hypothetical protein